MSPLPWVSPLFPSRPRHAVANLAHSSRISPDHVSNVPYGPGALVSGLSGLWRVCGWPLRPLCGPFIRGVFFGGPFGLLFGPLVGFGLSDARASGPFEPFMSPLLWMIRLIPLWPGQAVAHLAHSWRVLRVPGQPWRLAHLAHSWHVSAKGYNES